MGRVEAGEEEMGVDAELNNGAVSFSWAEAKASHVEVTNRF